MAAEITFRVGRCWSEIEESMSPKPAERARSDVEFAVEDVAMSLLGDDAQTSELEQAEEYVWRVRITHSSFPDKVEEFVREWRTALNEEHSQLAGLIQVEVEGLNEPKLDS